MPEVLDEDLIELLKRRDGLATEVRLRDGSELRSFNIAWGYDIGDRYAHVTTNISPSIDGENIDFFFTYEVANVADTEDGFLLYDAAADVAAATEWRLRG